MGSNYLPDRPRTMCRWLNGGGDYVLNYSTIFIERKQKYNTENTEIILDPNKKVDMEIKAGKTKYTTRYYRQNERQNHNKREVINNFIVWRSSNICERQ
jgi:hypothetical protein